MALRFAHIIDRSLLIEAFRCATIAAHQTLQFEENLYGGDNFQAATALLAFQDIDLENSHHQ